MKEKYFNYLLLIIGIFFTTSCKKASFHDKSVTLYSCSDKTIEPYICLDSLVEDSRCPIGAECFWQGTVIIQISFHERNHIHKLKMSLSGFPTLGYPHDTTINGYKIVFTDLKPYPEINKPAPKPTEIKAYFDILL